MSESKAIGENDIAIVGMAARLPGAPDLAAFWDDLKSGREAATRFSDRELRAAGIGDAQLSDPNYVRVNKIISDVDQFDADYFGLTAREAELIDPQQRIFLESAHSALEDTGYDPDTYGGSIGVYAGIGMNTYILNNLGHLYRSGSSVEKYQMMIANDKDFQAMRVSHKLNLTGPSLNVNTACSTSLVVTHLACLSLLNGECDMAVAGAVSIRFPQVTGYQHTPGMIFSPDGHCRAFDAQAAGTVLGDGVGIVVLKRLSDALADRDSIRAVIKGTAVNNDGALKVGFTGPSVSGQAAVIAAAHEVAGVDPETITYVEAHGTGTVMGDPVEVAGLTQAFRQVTTKTGYCALGSVKTNIGHLDVAAGMAGLIKTVLMLQHGALVPSLHYEKPNPEIDFAASPFFVNTEFRAWETGGLPRRAGVSSFGIGGTNAHAVLQEAPTLESAVSEGPQALLLSAKSPAALDASIAQTAAFLKRSPELSLADAAHTLAVGRKRHAHRCVVIAHKPRDAAMTLALRDADRFQIGQMPDTPPPLAFLFSAQGAALEPSGPLPDRLPVYRETLDAAAPMLSNLGGNAATTELGVLVRQLALATAFMQLGARPSVLAGDGRGLLTAAALAGVFSLGDTLALAAAPMPGSDQALREMLAETAAAPSAFPLLSPRLGRAVSAAEISDPEFWIGQLGQADQASAPPEDFALPEDTLIVSLSGQAGGKHAWLMAGLPDEGSMLTVIRALGTLWLRGIDIDWAAFHVDGPRRIPLPTYPFQRQRYWIEPMDGITAPAEDNGPELLKRLLAAETRQRTTMLTGHIQALLADISGEPVSTFDPEKPFLDFGLTSLMLIELAAKLKTDLDHPVPASSFVEHPAMCAFVAALLDELPLAGSGLTQAGAAPAASASTSTPAPPEPAATASEMAGGSETQIRRKRIRLDVS